MTNIRLHVKLGLKLNNSRDLSDEVKRMPKMDFGSAVLYITFLFFIVVAILLATAKVINTSQTRRAEASMYSRPTWYEVTTPVTSEDVIDMEEEEYE